MKQKHILTYFISSTFLLLFCVSVNAQNDSIASTKNDSIKIKQKYGLRIGGDIGKLIRTAIDDDYSGFEIIADYRLKKKLYIAGEIGIEEKSNVTDYLNTITKGSYLKGGIDYNLYQNWLDMDNMIFSGFRVGASSFSHTLNSFNVYHTNQCWGEQFASTTPQEFNGLTAIWVELILGLKAEILKEQTLDDNDEVLNGIAFDKKNNRIFVTGKHWSKLYEIELIKK